VVPPAFGKVGKDVFPGELKDLVRDVIEMEEVGISHHECATEPVNPVDKVIVIKIIPEVGPS